MSSREKREKGTSDPSPRRHTEGEHAETHSTIARSDGSHVRSTSGGKQNGSIIPHSPRPNGSGDSSSGGGSSSSSSGGGSRREKNLPPLSPRPNSNGSEISSGGGGSKREKALTPISPRPPGGSEISKKDSAPNTPKGSAINQIPQSDWVHKTKSGLYVDVAALARDFSDPLSGIRLFQTYFDIFTGAEVVDFIIANCKCSRKEAVPIGQELLDKGSCFEHVRQNRTFEDKLDVFYRLVKTKTSIDATQLVPYNAGDPGSNSTPPQPQQPQQPQQPINQTFTFLIHGWNDDIKQWKEIRNLLNEELGHPVYLFVYRSLDDNSTIENLAVRFHTFVNERIMESTTLHRPMTEEEKKKEMEKRKKKSKGSSRELVQISAPSNFRKRQIDRTVDNTQWLGLMQKYQLLDLDHVEFWEMLRTHFPSVYQNLPIIQLEKFIIENKAWFDEQRSKLKANVELWKEKKDQFVAETKEKTEELKEKTDQYIKEKKEKLVETKERMRDRKDLFVLETMEKTEQYIKEKREKLNETKERIRERKEKLMANLQSSDDKRDNADVEEDDELRLSYWRKKKLKRQIRNVERNMSRISEGGEGWDIMEQSESELKMNESTPGLRWKWRAGSIIRSAKGNSNSSNDRGGEAEETSEPKEEDEEGLGNKGSLIKAPKSKNKEKDEEKSIEQEGQEETQVKNELFEQPEKPLHPLAHTLTKKEVKRQRKLTKREENKREKERKEKEKADKKLEKQERKQKRREEKAKGKAKLDKKGGAKVESEDSKDSSEPSSMENSTDSQEPQQPQQPQQTGLSGSWRLGRVASSAEKPSDETLSEQKKDEDFFPVIVRKPQILIEALDEEEEEKARQAAALQEKEESPREGKGKTAKGNQGSSSKRKESVTTETEPAEDEGSEDNFTGEGDEEFEEEEEEEEGNEDEDEEGTIHTTASEGDEDEDTASTEKSALDKKLSKAERKQLAKKQKEDKERAKREQKEQLKEKKKQEVLERQRERKERLEQLRENRAKREKEKAEREKEKKGGKEKKKKKKHDEDDEGDDGDEYEEEGTEAVREHTEETELELDTEDEREKSIPLIVVETDTTQQPQPQHEQNEETQQFKESQFSISLRRKRSLSAEPLRAVMLSQLIADAVQQQQQEGEKREKEKPKQSRSEIMPLQQAEWKKADGHKRSRSVDAANNKIAKDKEREKGKEHEEEEEAEGKGITLGSRVQADLKFGETTYHASGIWCPNGQGCKETDPEHFKKFQHYNTELQLQLQTSGKKGEQQQPHKQIQNFNNALALRDEGKMTLAVVNTATTVRMEMKAMKAREKAIEKERKEKERELQRMRKEEKKKMKRERKERERELARQRKEMKKGGASFINMTGLEKDGVKINIVVYSTGALILRHFLRLYYWSHYRHKIDHVVMFAPANYGSPYAKKGKTGVGKYWVGQKTNFKHMFECGKELLTSLECSSPFLWDLAHHDIFADKSRQYFRPGEIKTFIMQGTETYDLAKIGTKLTRGNTMFGTDGTVTVSGASLRVKKLHLDLSSSSIANNTANKIIHHKKPPECSTQVVFRMQEQLNHRSIVDSLGGKTQAFDWLKQALSVEDEKEFMHHLEAELMHNSSLYNQGFIPGKLIIFRYKGDEDVMDEVALDMTMEMERQPKLRFEVLVVDESRLKGTMRKISFGMHVDHFCMTVIRDKAKVSPLLQAFGKFIYHSRSRKTFYFMLNPDKIHNEMLKLSQNYFNGKPIAVAGCLKGNPSCARLLVCSNLSTPLTDQRRYDHTHLIEITPPEKGVRDFAQEIDTKLIVLERQDKLQQKDGTQQEEALTEPAPPQLEVLQKILKLLKKDDDVDDTLHDIIERGLNRLVRPFGAQGRLADLLRMLCVEKLPELCVSCRKRLIKFLMGTPWLVSDEYYSTLAREAVVHILVNTSGDMLTQLKNGLDESDGTESFCENSDRNNLHRVVFHYLKNVSIQQTKLEFFKPYDVTASLLDDEKGEGCLPLQQLVMSHIRKEGDSWKEKRRKEKAENQTRLPTPKSTSTNENDELDLEGLDEEKKEKKRRKRTERERRREEMRVEVQKLEKEERKGKRFKVVSGIFDLLVHGMESVFPDESLFPGAQTLLERVVSSQKGGLVFLTGVRPATMTENAMLRRTHELLSRLNLPPRTVIELDISDTELNLSSNSTPQQPIAIPSLKSSYPSWSLSMPSNSAGGDTTNQNATKLSEEMRQRIMKLTLLRLKEYMSLYPEYKFILITDSENGDAQLMLTSLYEAMQGPKERR